MRQSALPVALVTVSIVATVALFSIDVRYKISGSNALVNGDFSAGLEGWAVAGPENLVTVADGSARIAGRGTGEFIGLWQTTPVSDFDNGLLIEAEIATGGVVGPAAMQILALIQAVCRLPEGGHNYQSERYFVSFVLPANTDGWRFYRDVLILPEDTETCLVQAWLAKHTNGLLEIRALNALPVQERPNWRAASHVLFGAWAILALWIGLSLLRSISSPVKRVIVVTAIAAVALASFVSQPIKSMVVDWLVRKVPLGLVGGETNAPHFTVNWVFDGLVLDPTKFGHIVLFASIAAITRVAWPIVRLPLMVGYLGLFAASAEVLQFFALDRHPRFSDWAIDVVGVLIGLGILALARCVTLPGTMASKVRDVADRGAPDSTRK